MKIALGSDHAGYEVKQAIAAALGEDGHEIVDCGCFGSDSVDYPDYAHEVARKVAAGEVRRGILVCGTGIGMSMAANHVPGIRAALCNEMFSAKMSREHNDANVLCLGARVIGPGLAAEIVRIWMTTPFAGGRHQRRIDMF